MPVDTVLVVVTTNAADSAAMARWLRPQLPPDQVLVATGYYAAMSAISGSARSVVADLGVPADRDDWRLAELRARAPEAAIVVLADGVHVDHLAAPLRADLAVTRMRDLPPLRELLVNDEPVVEDQTALRRTTR